MYNRITIDEEMCAAPGTDGQQPGGGKKRENYRQIVVTTAAYMLGVDDKFLAGDGLDAKRYGEMKGKKNATIIRNLCLLRNGFMRNLTDIRKKKQYDMTPLDMMGDLLNLDSIKYLRENGMETVYLKPGYDVTLCVAKINQYIADRIDAARAVFPEWVKFEYIKPLFLMPGCNEGVRGSNIDTRPKQKAVMTAINEERKKYLDQRSLCPFGVYINWPKPLREDDGNVLYNDAKFLKLLYAANRDTFKATEYVVDAPKAAKADIYRFVEEAEKTAMFVDCENVNPYSFLAMLLNLDAENIGKVQAIHLYNDVNTPGAWEHIKKETVIPVDPINTERVLDNKSLVDTTLAAAVSKALYRDGVDSIILVSSDSDFWGIISQLSEAKFFVLNEKTRTSSAIIEKLDENMIKHCFMDEFAQDSVQDFKTRMLVNALKAKIDSFNRTGVFEWFDADALVDELFREAYITGADKQMEQEKQQFYARYLGNGFVMKPYTDGDGRTSFKMELNPKH